MGRLPIIVHHNELSLDDLTRIVREPRNSVIRQYTASLKLDEVELEFEEGAVAAIAVKAQERHTGARGLRSIVESIMLDIMYDIPSMDDIKRVVVTREAVEDSTRPQMVLDGEEKSA